jgi:hypothetical protein
MRNSKISGYASAGLSFLLIFSSAQAAEPTAQSGGSYEQSVTEDAAATEATGLGKFWRPPFRVSLSVRGGYDDNVTTSTFDRQGSAFGMANLSLNYDIGNPRTQLDLTTSAGVTYYVDRPTDTDYDISPNLALVFTHKATPRLTVAANVYAAYQKEPEFSRNVGLNRRGEYYFFTRDQFSVAYRWLPRFSTNTSYTLGVTQYEQSAVGLFQDRFEHTFGNEFRFLLWPMTTVVGEYRFGMVRYDNFPRDSDTNYVLAGFDHSFSRRFNVSLRAGVEHRSYANFGEDTGPYGEGTLSYALGARTSISWTSRYAIEEPDVGGARGRTTFRTGLRLTHSVTPRIVTSLSAFYQHDENEPIPVGFFGFISPGFAEDSLNLSVSARYAITRNWGIDAGYDLYDVWSELPFREYYRNRFYGGVNLAF